MKHFFIEILEKNNTLHTFIDVFAANMCEAIEQVGEKLNTSYHSQVHFTHCTGDDFDFLVEAFYVGEKILYQCRIICIPTLHFK